MKKETAEENDVMTSGKFIARTKALIKQYENFHKAGGIKEDEYYNITLLVNCLYGLLMMPSKKFNDKLKEYENDGIMTSDLEGMIQGLKVKVTRKDETENIADTISIENFVRGLRNGLGHWEEGENNSDRVSYPLTSEENLKTVILKGDCYNKYDVEARFEISNSRNCILEFIEKVILVNS